MSRGIIGWDIGGAHLKVAFISEDGVVKAAYQVACPLWQGINQLQVAIEQAQQKLEIRSLNDCQHSVTMTAELVDLFEHRDEGVEAVLSVLNSVIDPDCLWIFCGRAGLVNVRQVMPEHYLSLASANWMATAMFVAEHQKNAILVDIGSTTTDIVTIENHQVYSSSVNDFDRLLTDELVYTGVVRTPVMAISRYSVFRGCKVPLVAEYFATMADVYRILNELPEHADQGDTADGKAKSVEASTRRLARMIGLDQRSASTADWSSLAMFLRGQQLFTITQAARRRLSAMSETCMPVIGAGVGRFLARDVAVLIGLEYLDFNQVIINDNIQAVDSQCIADYAPAVAVARLMYKI